MKVCESVCVGVGGGGGGGGAFRIVSDWHYIFKYKAGLDTDYRCFRHIDSVREKNMLNYATISINLLLAFCFSSLHVSVKDRMST